MIDLGAPRPRHPYESVVPLINVVFLLLIFFLLAGTLQPADPTELDPPKGETEESLVRDPLMIYMEADGYVWLDGIFMDGAMASGRIGSIISREGQQPIVIKADKEAPAHEVIGLMERLQGLGVEEVTLVTVRGDQ